MYIIVTVDNYSGGTITNLDSYKSIEELLCNYFCEYWYDDISFDLNNLETEKIKDQIDEYLKSAIKNEFNGSAGWNGKISEIYEISEKTLTSKKITDIFNQTDITKVTEFFINYLETECI